MRIALLLALLLAGCSDQSGMAGSSSKKAESRQPKPESESESEGEIEGKEETAELTPDEPAKQQKPAKVRDTSPVPQAQAPDEAAVDPVQASTPDEPLDVSSTGFSCADDMRAAAGEWKGTYEGQTAIGPVSGIVRFAMQPAGHEILNLERYAVVGGIGGVDMTAFYKIPEIDFQLRCGDAAMKPIDVVIPTRTITWELFFTRQSWTPPSIGGTWIATDQSNGQEVGRGAWNAKL